MAAPHNLDHQIEQYLMGTLPEADERALLDLARQDPDLSGQIEWQRQVLEQLRLERRRELKTRLAAVPVGVAVYEGARLWQGIAAGTSIIMIAGAAWWLWPASPADPSTARQTQHTVATAPQASPDIETPHESTPLSSEDTPLAQEPEARMADDLAATTQQFEADGVRPGSVKASTPAQRSAPERRAPLSQRTRSETPAVASAESIPSPGVDVVGRGAVEAPQTRHIIAPTGQITSADQLTGRPEVVISEANELAYQYYAGKLYLYGSFGGELYELIELYGEQGQRKLFVYYLGQFYPVLNETQDVTRLKALTDPATIAELNLLRRRRVD